MKNTLLVTLSVLLVGSAAFIFFNKKADPTVPDSVITNQLKLQLDSLAGVNEKLISEREILKNKYDSVQNHYQILILKNKINYEKAIATIDTLSTDQLISIFAIELSNEIEN